jgi:hypothetical protein
MGTAKTGTEVAKRGRMTLVADVGSARTRGAAGRDAVVVMETARVAVIVVIVVIVGCATMVASAVKVSGESEEAATGAEAEEMTVVGAQSAGVTFAKGAAKPEEMTAEMTVVGAQSAEVIVAMSAAKTEEMTVVGAQSAEMTVAMSAEKTEEMTVVGAQSAEVIVRIEASERNMSVREKTGAEIARMRGQNTTRWISTRRSDISTTSVGVTRRGSDITAKR